MQGTIVQVSISSGGLPKKPIAEGVAESLGIVGDGHVHAAIHGGPRKAILLVAIEVIEELRTAGFPLFPGALGENLTISGIDMRALRPGDRLRAGEALLEITQLRSPCFQLDVYGPSLKDQLQDARTRAKSPDSPRWGKAGFYAAVVTPGTVRAGDIIAVVASQA